MYVSTSLLSKTKKFVKEMSEEADMIEQTTIAEEQKILDYVKTMF